MTNRYDEKYEIRLARYDEINEIMEFIDKEWKKGHIMAHNRELFEYEFVHNNQVCFMIAKERETNTIIGVQGFIVANDLAKPDIWGSIWKVKNDAMPMLGVEIERRLVNSDDIRYDIGVGVNTDTTLPLLRKLFKYDGFRMKHFYRLSTQQEYHIAKILQHRCAEVNLEEIIIDSKRFMNVSDIDDFFDAGKYDYLIPKKDNWYVKHRYFNHPIYNYEVYGLFENKRCDAILVLRKQEYNESAVYRIVDYIGNQKLFGGLYGFFTEKLENVEYIDFYCYGMDIEAIKSAGFIERDKNDDNIIPNYFAPFVQKNIEIWAVSPAKNVCCFKADADQDRPN